MVWYGSGELSHEGLPPTFFSHIEELQGTPGVSLVGWAAAGCCCRGPRRGKATLVSPDQSVSSLSCSLGPHYYRCCSKFFEPLAPGTTRERRLQRDFNPIGVRPAHAIASDYHSLLLSVSRFFSLFTSAHIISHGHVLSVCREGLRSPTSVLALANSVHSCRFDDETIQLD